MKLEYRNPTFCTAPDLLCQWPALADMADVSRWREPKLAAMQTGSGNDFRAESYDDALSIRLPPKFPPTPT